MAGKKKTEKEGSSWIGEIEKYSRQIWLAGLGAYSKISNDGSKLFETLVKDGEKAEKETKVEAEQKVEDAKRGVKAGKSRVGDVKDLALGKWNELEGAFDKRLNSAISRLGVPSRLEVQSLHDKVDQLTRQIEHLTGAKVKPVAARPAARSTAKPLVKAAASAVGKTADKVASKATAAKPALKKAAAKPATAVSKAASATAGKAKSVAADADKKSAAPKKPAVAKKPAAPRKPAAKAVDKPAAAQSGSAPASATQTPAASAAGVVAPASQS